jgi:hypothetical protein
VIKKATDKSFQGMRTGCAGGSYLPQSREKMARMTTAPKVTGEIYQFPERRAAQFFVVVGGLTLPGTRAGSELIADPAYLSSVLKNAPHQWPQINMEAVIESGVTDGETGPPKGVAPQFL